MYALNNGSFENVTNVSNSIESVIQSVVRLEFCVCRAFSLKRDGRRRPAQPAHGGATETNDCGSCQQQKHSMYCEQYGIWNTYRRECAAMAIRTERTSSTDTAHQCGEGRTNDRVHVGERGTANEHTAYSIPIGAMNVRANFLSLVFIFQVCAQTGRPMRCY